MTREEADEIAAAEVFAMEAPERIRRLEAERNTLKTAIEKARKLHQRDDSNPRGPWCPTCMSAWPCWTVAALDGGE